VESLLSRTPKRRRRRRCGVDDTPLYRMAREYAAVRLFDETAPLHGYDGDAPPRPPPPPLLFFSSLFAGRPMGECVGIPIVWWEREWVRECVRPDAEDVRYSPSHESCWQEW